MIDYNIKFNLLYDSNTNPNIIHSIMDKFDTSMPSYYHMTLPISKLENEVFWQKLSENQIVSFVSIDPCFLFFDDKTFLQYAKKIAQVKCDAICVFPYFYGYATFSVFENRELDEKLYKRTLDLANIAKSETTAIIVSPGITKANKDFNSRNLDYFYRTHAFFDAYALHVEIDYKENNIAYLVTLLKKVLSIDHKPVFVTKWVYPLNTVNSSNTPNQIEKIEQEINSLIIAVEITCSNSCIWFYSGTCKDIYRPDIRIGKYLFWEHEHIPPYYFNYSEWQYIHFCGLVDCHGNIKNNLVSALKNIAISRNNHVSK